MTEISNIEEKYFRLKDRLNEIYALYKTMHQSFLYSQTDTESNYDVSHLIFISEIIEKNLYDICE